MPEFSDDQFRRIGINRLVLRDHHSHFHQGFHDFSRAFRHAVGQFRHCDRFGKLHFAYNFFSLGAAAHGFLPRPLLFAAHRGH